MGLFHDRVGRVVRWGSWVVPMRRARRPVGGRRVAAVWRMDSKCSTARRVTISGRVIFG